MNIVNKIFYLLTPQQKKALFILSFLLLIGMAFEMLGLGILIPALTLMTKSDIGAEYPFLKPFLHVIGNPSRNSLVFMGMTILIILYFFKAAFLLYLTWKQQKFSANLAADLSHKLFFGYLRMPYTFHLERNSAHLLRNIQGEVGIFTGFSQSVIFLTTELSVVVSIAFMLVLVEPVGAVSITLFLGFFGFVFHKLTKKKLLEWGENRQYYAGMTGKSLLQGLGGVKDVKVLGREKEFLEEFSEYNNSNAKLLTKVTTLGQVPRLYLELLAVTGLAGLIIIFILQNKSLDLLVPTLGIFVAAAFRMIPSVNRIMSSVQNISYSKPVINILYDEFHLIENIKKSSISDFKIDFNSIIQIDNIMFRYQGAATNALNNINMTIHKGESVGFIGQSGSGKSTLVDVILGLLTPDSGSILVDNCNINDNIRAWQSKIGYVPQSIYLTDDTLKRNIAFGLPEHLIDDKAIREAIIAAQLDTFIDTLPDGLQTIVGERGVRLSGGQRQRIGIARALYHNPSILVLDEATSALDTATEQGVMEALKLMKGKRTLIIVAHRMSTVEDCNTIYKLKHGKIIHQGSPKEILENKIVQ